jgi:hypothetical protein
MVVTLADSVHVDPIFVFVMVPTEGQVLSVPPTTTVPGPVIVRIAVTAVPVVVAVVVSAINEWVAEVVVPHLKGLSVPAV